jgi:hypothetical protein
MKNGDVYIFSKWLVIDEARAVSGEGQLLGVDRHSGSTGSFTVPLADVAIFETNVVETSPSVAGMAIVTGVSALVTVACLANPKACFGSCPTFYASDGKQMLLQAEGFSDSVAPSLEARDIDSLYRTQVSGRDLKLRMTNEALETHVVKEANILAVPRPPKGGRVFVTTDGTFWQAASVALPVVCKAAEGDCLSSVKSVDGIERFSATDENDLATREFIDLEFNTTISPDARLGVVLGARQTLLSTFVLYQGLAYMGGMVGKWFSAVEQGDRALLDRARSFLRVLGGIEILVTDDNGEWLPVGEINETGPLAADVHLVPLPFPEKRPPKKIRLRKWRANSIRD